MVDPPANPPPLKRARGRPKKDPSEKAVQSAYWDYTVFDTSDDMLVKLKSLQCKQHIIALERCPETDRLHLQGRIHMLRKYSFGPIKKVFAGSHIEASKCTIDDNYMRKLDGQVLYDVDNRHQGKKLAWSSIRRMVIGGCTIKDVAEHENCTPQSFKSASLLMPYYEPERTAPVEVIISVGVDAESKARQDHASTDIYKPPSLRFWEGYDAHDTVLIHQSPELTRQLLSQLVSPHPFRVGVKGASRQARYTKIYVCAMTDADLPLFGALYDEKNRCHTGFDLQPLVTRYL